MMNFTATFPGISNFTMSVEAPTENVARLKLQELFGNDNFIIEEVSDFDIHVIDND